MKANDSSPSLLNIMIPKFQQLLPYETPASGIKNSTSVFFHNLPAVINIVVFFFVGTGSWLHSPCTPESTKKHLSSPMSVTPTSTCTGKAK